MSKELKNCPMQFKVFTPLYIITNFSNNRKTYTDFLYPTLAVVERYITFARMYATLTRAYGRPTSCYSESFPESI